MVTFYLIFYLIWNNYLIEIILLIIKGEYILTLEMLMLTFAGVGVNRG